MSCATGQPRGHRSRHGHHARRNADPPRVLAVDWALEPPSTGPQPLARKVSGWNARGSGLACRAKHSRISGRSRPPGHAMRWAQDPSRQGRRQAGTSSFRSTLPNAASRGFEWRRPPSRHCSGSPRRRDTDWMRQGIRPPGRAGIWRRCGAREWPRRQSIP